MANATAIVSDEDREEAVFNAISAIDDGILSSLGAWDDLDILSSSTLFEGLEAAPGGVLFETDGRFIAAATVYITLQYGPSRDSVSMSDSYPATVKGHIDAKLNVEIESVEVDTESFYGD